MVLVSWKNPIVPKFQGSCGKKIYIYFLKIPCNEKCLETPVGTRSLGSDHKIYFSTISLEDWIQTPNLKVLNSSIIWKSTISTFPLIGNLLILIVGKGDNVQIDMVPCIGSKEAHSLQLPLV